MKIYKCKWIEGDKKWVDHDLIANIYAVKENRAQIYIIYLGVRDVRYALD